MAAPYMKKPLVLLLALSGLVFVLAIVGFFETSAWHIIGIRAYVIPSASMSPTLQPGDRFFVDTFAYLSKPPKRGDVITFLREDPDEGLFVKRVIAVGGDSIECDGDRVILNGAVLHETYVAPATPSEAIPVSFGPATVPVGKLFVMGDSRSNSNDSRYFGFIDSKQVRGKVLYIYFSKDSSRIGRIVR